MFRRMNATKILWGQILLVSLVVLAFVWTATEWTAWRLRFQPQLGPPWFELFGWPVYQPQDFFWWWFAFEAYAPHVFDEGGYIAAAGGVAAVGLAKAMPWLRGRWRKDSRRHTGPEHVLCFAPTRSGKGVGLVVPTLLTWPGSAIVHDIKGENWTLTAGWRSRFGRAVLFDPTNVASSAF